MSILRVLGVILHRGLKAVLQLGLRCGFYCLSLCVLCRWVSVVLAAQTIARRCFSRKADGKPGKDLLYTQGAWSKLRIRRSEKSLDTTKSSLIGSKKYAGRW